MGIPSRADWLLKECGIKDIVSDKESLIKHYVLWMLSQTVEMFEYGNLPESIPEKEIELFHQINGSCIWKEVNGKKYVFTGGLGGVLNEYYHPTRAIISNPYLSYTADLVIDKECVVSFNNKLRTSLLPLLNKYAVLMAECDISIRFATINARIPYLVNANDDNTRESVQEVFKKIWDGKEFGIALNKRLMDKDGVFTSEFGSRSQSTIKDLIELKQYLKSSWYLDVGIQSNYNMKRESLNSSETAMDEDVLIPYIDDALEQRKNDIKKVNEMWGTDITVNLSSSWKKIREEIKLTLLKMKSESKQEESGTEDSTKEKEVNEDDKKETNPND